ncbi:hypothetical protein ACIQLJ_05365 [Microbacterium sp. NPDC091313]
MRLLTRVRVGALVLAFALALPACAAEAGPRVTRLPSDGTAASSAAPASPTTTPPVAAPSVSASADAPGLQDCTGRSVTITPGDADAPLSGECAQIEVQGNALYVDASTASAAVLSLAGDRISVRVGRAGQLVISGNDVVVSATEVSMLDIRGDRNTVTVSGTLGGVSFQGNDNVVHGSTSSVSDGGTRNTVG